MESLSNYNTEIKYLLCAIDLYSKYAWVVPLRGISIVNAFQKIITKERKPNEIWVYQGGKFYNKLCTNFLKINNTEVYSTCNEGKSVLAERFIRTLKNKIFKHMAADVTSDSYAEYNEDPNVTKPKFKVGDRVRISKYKNIFAKGYTQNWSEEVFVVSKIKNTVPWTYVVSDLNGEEITGSFYEKELQKTTQEKFRIEKIINKKGDKLCVKWKGYDNSFNS